MKVLLVFIGLTLSSLHGVTGTSDLPRPWLTVNRSATVLHLHCQPPPEALDWEAVQDLRLSAWLSHHSVADNTSLAYINRAMQQPATQDFPAISRVTFEGTWKSKSPFLTLLMPVTSKELGPYFCTGEYSDRNGNDGVFSTKLLVEKDFIDSHVHQPPRTRDKFKVSVTHAHEVSVTWRKPKHSKFTEASVSVIEVDDTGKNTAPSISLFTTNGVRHFSFKSEVLLSDFNTEDSDNVSITLYVDSGLCSASCRYSCRVPYPACLGHTAVFCTCCQEGTNPDRDMCPASSSHIETSPTSADSINTPFIVCLIILVIISPSVIMFVLYCGYKTGRCKNRHVTKLFAPPRECLQGSKQDPSPPREGLEGSKQDPANSENTYHFHAGSSRTARGKNGETYTSGAMTTLSDITADSTNPSTSSVNPGLRTSRGQDEQYNRTDPARHRSKSSGNARDAQFDGNTTASGKHHENAKTEQQPAVVHLPPETTPARQSSDHTQGEELEGAVGGVNIRSSQSTLTPSVGDTAPTTSLHLQDSVRQLCTPLDNGENDNPVKGRQPSTHATD